MIRVVIAEDHAIVRAGLKRILGESPDIEVVAEAADGHQALERVRESRPDVVVLDVTMPRKDGLDTLKELRAHYPDLRILILSMHPEEELAARFLRQGADGYMTKQSAPEQLLGAIRKIHAGGKYVSAALAERLAARLDKGFEQAPHESLSDREFQVLCLIGAGKSVTEIGEELRLSVKTISTYRQRLLEKLGMKTTAEIMHYVIQRKLVS
ncbi:MAG: response regulator transcription factor [bacterium]|nr:response regulator transcription factor [bacterium]